MHGATIKKLNALVIFEFIVYLAMSVPYILVVNGTFFAEKLIGNDNEVNSRGVM
jgi:hypothetical protein